MKTKILKFVSILLVLIGSLSSCKEKEYYAKEGRVKINKNEYISIRLSPNTGCIGSSVMLIIENHTKGFLNYGHEFSLEYLDNGNWIPIQLDLDWSMILLGLSTGNTDELQFNLLEEIFLNGPGKYRIIKKVSLFSDFAYGVPSDFIGSFYLYTEIEIINI
ncbi:hypothetical protein FACS1894178_8400 [Bacteroidia bacterium]|nr:hypothetical protein FACS1894178_8400 [Bacteroidia bacterium]